MNKKGFTLIEVMIVVVILMIIASIAVPAFKKRANNSYKKPQEQTRSGYREGDTVVLKIFPQSKCIVSRVGSLNSQLSMVRCVNDEGVISSLESVSLSELQ